MKSLRLIIALLLVGIAISGYAQDPRKRGSGNADKKTESVDKKGSNSSSSSSSSSGGNLQLTSPSGSKDLTKPSEPTGSRDVSGVQGMCLAQGMRLAQGMCLVQETPRGQRKPRCQESRPRGNLQKSPLWNLPEGRERLHLPALDDPRCRGRARLRLRATLRRASPGVDKVPGLSEARRKVPKASPTVSSHSMR